jgi:hypothetical protein
MSKAKTEPTTRPITVCIRCLVALTDHESGECDDCLDESFLEAELAMAAALISKQKNEKVRNEN